MKIVHVVQSPQRRGAEVFANQLARQLTHLGQAVSVVYLDVAPSHAATIPQGPCETTLGNSGTGAVSQARRLIRLLKEERPDIVQSNGGDCYKVVGLAAWMHSSRDWQFVYRSIGRPSDWLDSTAKRWFYKTVIWPKVDGVSAVSQQTVADLEAIYGTEKKMRMISRGVDLSQFRPRNDYGSMRADLGILDGEFAVAWVGALSPEKRPDRALRVLAGIKGTNPTIHLILVGTGELEPQLIEMARELGVSDVVHFVGGVSDVRPALSACQVFLLTSDTEGIPGAMLEAMALGLPVVATAVGGVPEAVRGDSGFLTKPEDEKSLSAALVQLAEDRDLCRQMGDAGMAHVRSRYDLRKVATEFLGFYHELLCT